jgi:uncharacterized protein with FMN-binding domain
MRYSENMKRTFSWILPFFLAVICLIAACVNLDAIVITSPDLSKVADGIYQGKAKVGPVRVTLDVAVRDGVITSIDIIRHFNGRGKKAEVIVPKIIEAQSLEVDVISGATGSSKAFLLAVENALAKK